MSIKKTIINFIHQLHPLHRVLISLGLSGLMLLGIQNTTLDVLVKLLILWDVYVLSYCVLSWVVFFTHTCSQTKEQARKEDGSRIFVYFVIILSSLASLITVLLLLMSLDNADTSPMLYAPIAVVGMLLSWMMVHITFTFHYAHLYYDDDEQGNTHEHVGGLNFPNETKPDYLDFAYFSFTIGMTFQVSDVQVTSRQLRKVVLFQSLLSFALNTFVVALTINLVAGLAKG